LTCFSVVHSAIIEIDATPYRQWYEAHYAQALGRKTKVGIEQAEAEINKPRSARVQRKIASRQGEAKVDVNLEHQFVKGRLYACISSRPGQSGRADGYILEGKELEFYMRKMTHKR
jgi:small subunit ribosomal protein S8e